MAEYISKHDAYTLLKDLEAAYIYPPVREAYGTAARRIDQMKAADVQPVVHGKWDTHDVVKVLCSGKTLDGFCQCEACGDVFPLAYSKYNFCPNCGARMKQEAENA